MYCKWLDLVRLDFVLEEMLEYSIIVCDTMVLNMYGIILDHADEYALVPPLRVWICLVQLFVVCPLLQKHMGIVAVLNNEDSGINITIPQITTEYEICLGIGFDHVYNVGGMKIEKCVGIYPHKVIVIG